VSSQNGNGRNRQSNRRGGLRANILRQIMISCEGQDDTVLAKPPNLSKGGMFINTSRCFPEGTVLNLRFELSLTGARIEARSEVRYSEPGVGVGVQFIGLSDEAGRLIEREIGNYQHGTPQAMPRRHINKAATPVRPRRA
jgi:PilZ domain